MKVLITEAKNPYYHSFEEFKTFEELLRFKKTCGNDLILRDNDFFDCPYLDEVADYYETNFEIADRIRKCEFEVLIYNDYIE